MNQFGLSDRQYSILKQLLQNRTDIEETIIFGSRALGTYSNGSDLDIALKGPRVTLDTVINLYHQLETSDLIFKVDLVDYEHCENPELKDHIDKQGVSLK